MRTIVALLGALTLVLPAGAQTERPRQYYLALGDSVAYGFQPTKEGLAPSAFDTGYVDVFAKRLQALAPRARVVNYACPGEATTTFVSGGCAGRRDVRGLHNAYQGSQQAAALTFLKAHPGQVSPITLTLGVNDLNEAVEKCGGKFDCVRAQYPAALRRVGTRLGTILGRLRAAAPGAEIIVTGAWNFDLDHLAVTEPLFAGFNATVTRSAAGARARYADITRISPKGPRARREATLCRLTFICSKDDPHPTDAGYRAIADAVWKASGY